MVAVVCPKFNFPKKFGSLKFKSLLQLPLLDKKGSWGASWPIIMPKNSRHYCHNKGILQQEICTFFLYAVER